MEESLTPWQKYKQNLGDTRPWDILDSKKLTEEDIATERFVICKACPELIKLTKTCKKCGCFMGAKTKIQGAACPIGKW